jgi:hypothetical protein
MPKIHKNNIPIRPVINWRQAPAYKLAKLLTHLIQTHIPLLNTFNVKNSIHLINDLKEIQYQQGIQLVSLDIENMYPSIPTEELKHVIKSTCTKQNIEEKLSDEILYITQTILQQNYFQFQNKCYIQERGLAMGAPSSSILSEIFLQYLEQNKVHKILTDHNILGYFRYVDDILIVFNNNITDIHTVFKSFNELSPTIKFTMETELDNQINFLDITIHRDAKKIHLQHIQETHCNRHHHPIHILPPARTQTGRNTVHGQ